MARGSIRRHAALPRCSRARRRKACAFAFLADLSRLFQKVGVHRFQTKRGLLMKLLVAVCAILILVTIISAMSVGWLLAHPIQTRIGDPPADLNAEQVTFASDSGATVHGWWCPIQNANGAVLLLPGIRANRLSMVDRARFLHRSAYSVLLIDFQATGETAGDHITFGWKESRDVLAAIDFIRQADPTAPVAIIGSSLVA